MGRNRDLSTDPDNLAAMWRLAKPIYKELKQTGLSDLALAGILGNMAQECTFNPNAEYKGHFGYLQNTDDIVRWITKHFGGYGHTNQMNYMIAGLTRQLPQIDEGVWLQDRFNDYLNNVGSIKSVPQAVALWESAYEKAKGQNLRERINYGKYLYELILKEPEEFEGPVYSPNGEMNIYLKVSPPDEEEEQRPLSPYELVHLKLLQRQKNLPKIPYKAHKKGGRLIRRGLSGMQVIHDPNNPYNVALVLEKDPLPEDYEEPNNIGKYGYVDITPLARMDETVLLLNQQVSPITKKLTPKNTYTPTPDTPKAIYQKPSWTSYLGLAPVALPAAVGAVATAPVWGPAVGATLSNPAFWIEAGKDLLTYIAADVGSLALTGKSIGAHVNNAIGLEEDHPVGEFIGFGGTGILRRPVEQAAVSTYKAIRGAIQPKYALAQAMDKALWKPYVSRVVGENGKIRLRLPSHTDAAPREVVLEPQGNNKFYVHIRTWNDVEGKIPANLTSGEIGHLYEALYDELPEGAEILFPKSGPGNYATRGTVAGLLRLARDPRYIKGNKGKLLYVDKDNSIKKFEGTSFLKKVTYKDDYVTRQLIPFAKLLGNWAGHNNVTNTVLDNIIPFNEESGSIGGEFSGTRDYGKILLNTGIDKEHIGPILLHEIRHAYDYWPKYQITGRGNPIIRFLGMDPRDLFSSLNQAIKLTNLQLELLNKAYPHTFMSKLKGWIQGNDFYRITEKTAVNAELRKMFDDYFIEKYNKVPSVEELNTFIQELPDIEFFKILGKMFYRSPYMDAYLTNISKSIPGTSPRVKINIYPKTDLYPALNIGVRESVLTSDQLKLIRQALTSVPSIAGIGYGVYNTQQTQ